MEAALSELTEAEMRSIEWRKHYLPKAIRNARAKLEQLEREAIDCGRSDLVLDMEKYLNADAINRAWESEIALGKLRDREAT